MIDPVTLLLCLVLLVLPFFAFKETYMRRREFIKKIEAFGGEKCYPIIGTAWSLMRAGRKGFFKQYLIRNKLYGPVFRTWMGSMPAVHLMKPEHVEIILKSNTNITKGTNYNFVTPWLGESILLSTGNKWRHQRKQLTPTFHFKILDSFQEIFAEKSQTLTDLLACKADGNFFDIYPLITRCTLDIICETAMGVNIDAMNFCENVYVQAISRTAEFILQRMFNPLLHSDIIYYNIEKGRMFKKYLNILHNYSTKVIQEKKAKLKLKNKDISDEDILLGKKERLAFLDHILEGSTNFTEKEIRQEVDTFMFAGHDTSTGSVCWTLFALGNYPEVQEKVFQELDNIFHGEERPITIDDLNEMKYLDRVIKESLRLFSVVPVIVRTLDEEVIIDGKPIPKGVLVAIHIHEVHKNSESFPDPLKFDPDRFLPDQRSGRHPYSFIPFSAGPRNCIGQKFAIKNTKTILASILRKFEVKAMDTPETMEYFSEIVLRPQNGMMLSLKKRTRL